jgi:hypothetical protein
MEKLTVARKEYTCDACGHLIKKGEGYNLFKGKCPRFDKKDNQIGVEFFTSRLCGNRTECADRFNKSEGYLKCSKCGRYTFDTFSGECFSAICNPDVV